MSRSGEDVHVYLKRQFYDACISGDVAVMERLISLGADVNKKYFWKQETPLHLAALNGHGVVVELLLKAGANHSAIDHDQQTPLHWAAENGHDVVVELLLKAGANHSTIDNDQQTPLHFAAQNGHDVVVELLLKAGANHSAIDYNLKTPLHFAAQDGYYMVVDILLKAGANHSAINNDQQTPLHWAAENGHAVVVELLLNAGANHSTIDCLQLTPLHLAARNGHDVVVELLLKAGAIHSAIDEDQQTPLHLAAENGHDVVVVLLLKAGANHSAINNLQLTPLHLAARNEHVVVVELLLKAGANHSAIDDDQQTPLHWAAENGHDVVVELLLKAGANHSAINNENPKTPLHFAAENGHDAVVELLLKAGANHTAIEDDQRTPLHLAARNGHDVVVEILLKAGANHSAIDDHGNTPMHFAAERRNIKVMEVLIQYGASVTLRNKDGFFLGSTPLDYMKQNPWFEEDDRVSIQTFATKEKKRQKDSITLFMKQCKENSTVDVFFIKCILTGLPGVGKTSFLRRIEKKLAPSRKKGKELDVIPSTGFESSLTVNIADDSTSITAAAITSGHWTPTIDLHDQGSFLLSLVKHQHGSAITKSNCEVNPSGNFNCQQDSTSSCTSHSRAPAVNVADNLPDVKLSKKALKKGLSTAQKFVEKAVHRHTPADKAQNADMLTTVYFLDTGGQPEFHELLPPLLHGSAFHLIFFNAFQDLYKPVEVIYRHQEKSMPSIKYKSNSSSIDIVHQLLVSFFSISKKEKYCSVAALFGSHTDMLNEEKRAQELHEVSKHLEEAFRHTSLYQDHFLIKPRHENCPYIFQPLDNMTCSEEELERVQTFLTEVIQRQFSPVTLPVTWSIFHLSLREKYEKPSICPMKECIELAEECHIPAAHVPHVLEFFHFNLGTILYYSEISALRNYIIVNPNVLFQGISHLVTHAFMGSGQYHDSVQNLRVSGEIPAGVLRLNEPLSTDSPLTNQCIVDLLVHFKLLHVSQESSYFMPCLLLPDPDVVSSLVSLDVLGVSPPPLLILFEEGFVPIGLFSGVVNVLSQEWTLDKENRFRNRVKFFAPPGYVELRQCLKYIEVRAVNVESFCVSIRENMSKCLESVTCVQPHLAKIKHKFGFYCPGSLSSNLHSCEYSSKFAQALICTKAPKCFDPKLLPPQYKPWFQTIASSKKKSEDHSARGKVITPIDLNHVSDSLLTEDALLPALGECYEVVEWKVLGGALGVCEADLERIQRDEHSELLRQKAMLSRWISSGNASWRGLVDALLFPPLKAEGVAKAIAKKYTTW